MKAEEARAIAEKMDPEVLQRMSALVKELVETWERLPLELREQLTYPQRYIVGMEPPCIDT